MTSSDNDIRELVKAKIAVLQQFLAQYEEIEKEVKSGAIVPVLRREPTPSSKRAITPVVATSPGVEPTWPVAIDAVLPQAPAAGLRVKDIVQRLEAQGRKFPKGRKDVPVRVVLRRRGDAMGWRKDDAGRWSKEAAR